MKSLHKASPLCAAELAAVAGGWCGTVPLKFLFPRPEPEPAWDRTVLISKLDAVALNPQPLPPKEIGLEAFAIQGG